MIIIYNFEVFHVIRQVPLLQRDPSPGLISALVHHYDELVDHLRRRFGDKGFARDVMQDVCVQLLEQPPQTAVHTPFAFLRRVSTHLAIDRYRVEEGRRALVEPVADLPDCAADAPSHEDRLETHQNLDVLINVIENLPPRCREVFIMHKIHQIPQAQVAGHLNISRQMVEKHLRVGMAACRARLQADERN
ncbi:RNA polymerase sigma factor [Herbaspirillum chlorophenolicum]|jgi:RNA polymerase sigma-70 factor (ECF subfamily)|uniref:RNA polymerase sigma factor n=1 Tax=Herbaspirillum chlorophenolicum TaxID=211589 RepID=UPI0009E30405|nr:RNA polymerase sigma factor [Herbaspirillum chlorophenolicum]